MELDPANQREVLLRLAEAARARGLLVAPIGSVFFLLEGTGSLKTKDVDVVVHTSSGKVAEVEEVEALGRDLGEATVSQDRALVKVRMRMGSVDCDIDLLRGRRASKGGFLARELLEAAAARATRDGSVLLYPVEFVLLLKAEAAVDRARRAEKADRFTEENRRRAAAFRQDVFQQVQARLREGMLREDFLREGLAFLKENRREDVATLLEASSGGRLHLGSHPPGR